MTIEKEILKKLELVKKTVIGPKKTDIIKSEDIKCNISKDISKDIAKDIVKDERNGKSSSPFHQSSKDQSAILLLFDATGSMKSLWDATKDIIEEMIKRITEGATKNVKIKCVAYRDYCDGHKIFEKSGWHTDAKPLINFLGKIICDGGGDEPEAVEDALGLAYNEEDVTRIILIGDAPPHSTNKAVQQAKMLDNKGRPVFAFRVGHSPDTKISFSQIADASGGHYADINNYEDLLDMMSVTIIHDVGGAEEVDKYIKKYDISENVEKYSKSLPSYKR